MSFPYQPVVVVHLEHGFDLGHGVQIDADDDDERCAAEQIGKFAREVGTSAPGWE